MSYFFKYHEKYENGKVRKIWWEHSEHVTDKLFLNKCFDYFMKNWTEGQENRNKGNKLQGFYINSEKNA